ncbi:hypothetical protein ACFIQF_22685 [Comamonas sp. J-3]
MIKFVVLLKGAHKVGATIQLDSSDIVASAPCLAGAVEIKFLDVWPQYKEGLVDNIIKSVGVVDSLDGVARICVDQRWPYTLPITPNGGDIIWYPEAAPTNNLLRH